MTGWQRVRLADVMALDVNAVDVDLSATYPIVGVLNRGRGLLYRDPMPGSETKYKTLNRIGPGQVVYSRLKAFEGAITVAPSDLPEAYASQEFPTFTCGPDLLPAYFALLTTTPGLWDDLQNISTGMGGRRERVKPADFLTVHVVLPSADEQRRIVDVMASVDAQVEALAEEGERLANTTAVLRADYPDAVEVDLASVLLGIDSGKSVQTDGEEPRPDEARILKLSAVRPGRFDASEAKHLNNDAETSFSPSHLVSEGDLLVTRANTPERVGYVVVARSVPARTYMPDLIWRARVDQNRASADYLGHVLSSPEFRRRITGTAGGTSTSMVKINKTRFGGLRVPIPSLEAQSEYVAKCDAALRSEQVLAAELAALRAFRSILLTSLLNQSISIPESYDALLEPGMEGAS